MRKRDPLICLVVAAAILVPAMAIAQSLAEVARAEEARRKAMKGPVKVYTNEDLRRDGDAPPPPPAAQTSTTKPATPPALAAVAKPAPGTKPAEPSPAAAGKDEKYWRDRIMSARTALERSKTFIDALQSQINGLYTEFVNMDDPAQRAVIEKKHMTAMAEQERVKTDIAKQTKEIADIEDEARRAGVPPGWLR